MNREVCEHGVQTHLVCTECYAVMMESRERRREREVEMSKERTWCKHLSYLGNFLPTDNFPDCPWCPSHPKEPISLTEKYLEDALRKQRFMYIERFVELIEEMRRGSNSGNIIHADDLIRRVKGGNL